MGEDGGFLTIFEKDGDTYRKSKSFAIEGNAVKIKNLALSPTEEQLMCTLQNNQIFSLNMTNIEIMKVGLKTSQNLQTCA